MAGDINRPNGLAFSPDESRSTSIEAGVTPRVIRVYDVRRTARGSATRASLITARAERHARRPARATSTAISGSAGAWARKGSTASPIFNPDGKPIGRIDLPERVANVCFGGRHRNRLFMAASTSLYSLFVNTQGAPGA